MRNWSLFPLLLLAGLLVSCAKPSSSETVIEYQRSGGFAGLDDSLSIRASGEAVLTRNSRRYEFALDAETLNQLQECFENGEFADLHKQYLPDQQGSDRFEYIVTYRGHTVRTMDGGVPESLRPILEALSRIVEEHGGS